MKTVPTMGEVTAPGCDAASAPSAAGAAARAAAGVAAGAMVAAAGAATAATGATCAAALTRDSLTERSAVSYSSPLRARQALLIEAVAMGNMV